MDTEWFAELVNNELKLRGRGAGRKLAEALGVDSSQISKWSAGVEPGIYKAAAFLQLLGGDISRALPGWDATDSVPESEVCGQVQAGGVELAGECVYTVPGVSEAAWKGSAYWKRTHGRTILLEVQGDSMAPEYQEGELLACRQPDSPKDIKDGTPCIFREGNRYTFKILRRTKDKRVIGYPLNPAHMPIIFDASDEVRVEYVVLGKIDLGKKKR